MDKPHLTHVVSVYTLFSYLGLGGRHLSSALQFEALVEDLELRMQFTALEIAKPKHMFSAKEFSSFFLCSICIQGGKITT